MGNLFLPKLYLYIKGLIFVILSGCHPILLWFSGTAIFFIFFNFHPFLRTYISSTTTRTCFIIFVMKWMSPIKDKITTFHRCLQPNLISRKRWLEKFFYNFLSVIINHDFYVVNLWIHYTLFITVFRVNKFNCHSQLNFSCITFFEIISDAF